MKIIYFGVIDKDYSSNQIFLNGFEKNGVEIVPVFSHLPISTLNEGSDMSVDKLVKRILSKFKTIPLIFSQWKKLKRADCVFVGYPGHFDVPLAFILSRILSIPLIFYPVIILSVTFTDDVPLFDQNSLKMKLMITFEKIIYSLCDVIIADGVLQEQIFKTQFSLPDEKLYSVYLGANDSIYKASPLNFDDGCTCVMYYGMYSPLHSVETIIKAAKLLEKTKSIKFLLVGSGKTYIEQRKLAQNLKLKNVTFLPDVRESDAAPYLKKAHIFTGFLADSPTVKRQIPNKVYQGLALGKVVITADAPIMRDAFTHNETIYLIPPNDPKALARAITKLHENRPKMRKLASNAARFFHDNLTSKATANKVIKIVKNHKFNKKTSS